MMMTMHAIVFWSLCLAAVTAAPRQAEAPLAGAPSAQARSTASVTGKWAGTVTIQRPDGTESNPNPLQFDLTQKGEELTGTAGPPDQQQAIEKGAVVDDKVSFEVQPGPLYKFTLTLVEGRLRGEMTGERDGVVRVRGTVDAARVQ
jgi:hypothetical protein